MGKGSHTTSPSTKSMSPNVKNTNSLSPLTQNTTFTQPVDVESLEWHQFLTNQNDSSSKIEHESSSFSKTIAITALHCAVPESITASNIEWDKFIQAPDDNNITTTFDSESRKNRLYSNASNYKDHSNITMAEESLKVTQGNIPGFH